jgi:ketopantoate hydroxymethyltransferase
MSAQTTYALTENVCILHVQNIDHATTKTMIPAQLAFVTTSTALRDLMKTHLDVAVHRAVAARTKAAAAARVLTKAKNLVEKERNVTTTGITPDRNPRQNRQRQTKQTKFKKKTTSSNWRRFVATELLKMEKNATEHRKIHFSNSATTCVSSKHAGRLWFLCLSSFWF